jgi:hypothetical protein
MKLVIVKNHSILDYSVMNLAVMNVTLVIEKENAMNVRIKVNMDLNVKKIAIIVLEILVI